MSIEGRLIHEGFQAIEAKEARHAAKHDCHHEPSCEEVTKDAARKVATMLAGKQSAPVWSREHGCYMAEDGEIIHTVNRSQF